jgi:hypothetical protein
MIYYLIYELIIICLVLPSCLSKQKLEVIFYRPRIVLEILLKNHNYKSNQKQRDKLKETDNIILLITLLMITLYL